MSVLLGPAGLELPSGHVHIFAWESSEWRMAPVRSQAKSLPRGSAGQLCVLTTPQGRVATTRKMPRGAEALGWSLLSHVLPTHAPDG